MHSEQIPSVQVLQFLGQAKQEISSTELTVFVTFSKPDRQATHSNVLYASHTLHDDVQERQIPLASAVNPALQAIHLDESSSQFSQFSGQLLQVGVPVDPTLQLVHV